MTVVDTDILIDAGHGIPEAVDCLKNLKGSSALAMSVVTQMELLIGVRNKTELSVLDKFLHQFQILPLNEATSNQSVELLRIYRLSHGLLIADSLQRLWFAAYRSFPRTNATTGSSSG